MPEVGVECISFSVRTSGPHTHTIRKTHPESTDKANLKQLHQAGSRQVYDPPAASLQNYAVYNRIDLPTGTSIIGPLLVQEAETCTVVPSGFQLTVDDALSLVIEKHP